MNNTAALLLLASNSPRRRQLLALGGWTFDVDVSNIDETRLPGEEPARYVSRLSIEKTRAVLPRASADHLIIGSDTSVVIDGDILGKPADAQEARAMLMRLRGRTHQVYTGISVLRVKNGNIWTEVVVTDVPMRAYSADEIEGYIATGDPLDKAGAYGIQNPDFQPVASMAGCYASVMGLPLCNLSLLLRQAGLAPLADIPANCQATINYQCPVFQAILHGKPQNTEIQSKVNQ
jgi:MAF protein